MVEKLNRLTNAAGSTILAGIAFSACAVLLLSAWHGCSAGGGLLAFLFLALAGAPMSLALCVFAAVPGYVYGKRALAVELAIAVVAVCAVLSYAAMPHPAQTTAGCASNWP